MIIKIFHKEWIDNIDLDFKEKRMKRIDQEDEYANFELINNILYVNWDKWDKEIFIYNSNNNLYYYCKEIEFCHDNWNDTCYLDYFNKIIYRKNNNKKGYFKEIDNENIEIEWEDDYEIDNKILPDLIPNIIHFVYGFKEQKEEFELYRYLAIKSAYDVNKPDKIYFHYYYEPYGIWWDKIKPLLTLDKIDPPTEIYGNEIYHYAHKADIIRLQKLIKYGGIYLDIDTICLKSFNDLFEYDFVMGEQSNYGNTDIYENPNKLTQWICDIEAFIV
jgi:mannosyltransferase OCH1-like enzyme